MTAVAVDCTALAVALLESAPGAFSSRTGDRYVGCPGCRRSVTEHQIPQHAAKCVPLRARVSEGGAK